MVAFFISSPDSNLLRASLVLHSAMIIPRYRLKKETRRTKKDEQKAKKHKSPIIETSDLKITIFRELFETAAELM